jgi:hypothetical protein
MTKRIILGTALLLSTAVAGAAIAEGHRTWFEGAHHEQRDGASRHDDGARRAKEDSHAERHRGRHQDGNDTRGGSGRGVAIPENVPNDSNAPIPDNGLFNGKARPKVDVH